MNERLVIDELIPLRRLHFAVQDERPAVVAELDDLNVLKGSVFGEEDRFDAVEVSFVRP